MEWDDHPYIKSSSQVLIRHNSEAFMEMNSKTEWIRIYTKVYIKKLMGNSTLVIINRMIMNIH